MKLLLTKRLWIKGRPDSVFAIILMMLFMKPSIYGQENTVGLIRNDLSDDGAILFTPLSHKVTYLINRYGQEIHRWESEYVPGMTTYLADDGTLFRAGRVTDDTYLNSGGAGGIIEQFDWDGNVIWQYRYSTPTARQHHDFELLPNGNILILAWEKKTREQAEEAGRNPGSIAANQLWPDHLIEVKPVPEDGGEIVWEWHVWDHLIQDIDPAKANFGDVNEHPGRINLNHFQNSIADWIHGNALEYNADLDQIMLSSRGFNEVWIIDHSTTSIEAKTNLGGRSGMGGDLLWRWGNPAAYGRGTQSDQKLFGQHGIHWKWNAGSETSQVHIYNNGNGRKPVIYSTVETIEIRQDATGRYPMSGKGIYLPESPNRILYPDDSLSIYAPLFSNVIGMEDNHLLLCVGPRGTFVEFDDMDNEVWRYISPVTETGKILSQGQLIGDHQSSLNSVFSINYYPLSFSGFHGRDLTPKGVIEGEQTTSRVEAAIELKIYPNPARSNIYVQSESPVQRIQLIDMKGLIVLDQSHATTAVDVSHFTPGFYWCVINGQFIHKIMIIK